MRVDSGSRHVDNEARFNGGNIEEDLLNVGRGVGDANAGGDTSAVKVRGPNDDAHGTPHDHVTGGVRMGTGADRERGLVLGHLVGHEAREFGRGREVTMKSGQRVPGGRVNERVPSVRDALDHLGLVAGLEQGAEDATSGASAHVSGDDSVDVDGAVVKRQGGGTGAKENLAPHLLDTVG